MGNYTKQKLTTKPKKETKEVKATIDVDSKEQGAAINKALGNPVTKAAVVISGVLESLTPDQRIRVIKFVQESLDAGVITGD